MEASIESNDKMEASDKTKKKYDRIAPVYDFLESFHEIAQFSGWRRKFISPLKGKILEVGVGTGKNIPYYSDSADVIGIDFSDKMLARAKKRLQESGKKNIDLKKMDVEFLNLRENSFDYVVTSCVFCSVPNPVEGLKEIKRVLKPAGKAIMIEHVLSRHRVIAFFENLFNPLSTFLWGANINRDTKKNIISAGLSVVKDQNLAFFDVFRLFVSKK